MWGRRYSVLGLLDRPASHKERGAVQVQLTLIRVCRIDVTIEFKSTGAQLWPSHKAQCQCWHAEA